MGTKSIASLVLVFSLAATAQSHATAVTYDFSGSSSGLGTGNLGVSSATVSSSGLDVTVSAIDEFGAPGELARNNTTGLGVVGAPGSGGGQENQIGADANGGEALEFDFSPNSVTILESVVFETGFEAGSLNVLVGNAVLETISWSASDGSPGTGNSEIVHSFTSPIAARTAQDFTFQAVEDSFRFKSLTVEVIPEPTSLLLGAFALLALTANSRTRRV